MAHLLIIELPGGNDWDIVQSALDRGDEFTFLTSDLGLYRCQPEVYARLSAAREILEIPGFAAVALLPCVRAVHQVCPLQAVLCLIDIRIIEAATLAHALDLPFLNPASAKMLRDKFTVRECLARHHLRQPDFALAQTTEQLRLAVQHLGLPVLIKPCDGYGSQNIAVLRDAQDLDPVLSPLPDMLPSRTDYGLGVRANDRLLVERYMSGQLVGCDTLTLHGQHRLLGVNTKQMFEAPSFAIRGSCFTPNRGQFAELQTYAFAALDAVGFDCGAAHIEIMLTQTGPQLVEINPRLVGAKIARMMGLALGLSVHQALVELHLGQPLPDAPPRAMGVCVSRWLVADDTGTLDHVQWPDWHDPSIGCVEMLKHPGDAVRPPWDNADRLGYVMVRAATVEQAQEIAERYVADTRIVLRESPQHPH